MNDEQLPQPQPDAAPHSAAPQPELPVAQAQASPPRTAQTASAQTASAQTASAQTAENTVLADQAPQTQPTQQYPQQSYAQPDQWYGQPGYGQPQYGRPQQPYGQQYYAPQGQPQGQPQAGQYAYYPQQAPAFEKPRKSHRTRNIIIAASAAGCLALAAGLGGAGIGAYALLHSSLGASGSTSQSGQAGQSGQGLGGGQSGQGFGSQGGSGSQGLGGQGGQGFSGGQGGTNGSSDLGSATSAQEVGVVDIDTELSYEGGEAAGTGMILTSKGEVLTNNHVVEGSTSIEVTVVSTGKTYKADVVGTDEKDDVAVIQLENASGLTPIATDSNASLSSSSAVTAVGNAGGTGGTPSAAPGTVTGVNKAITTEAEDAVASESLTGLIETNADIEAGDSGGPLLDSSNKVVGMDTAASADSSAPDGYAIPIGTALGIAKQIESGTSTASIIIGLPAFLGVEVAQDGSTSGGDQSGLGDGQGLGDNGFGGQGGQQEQQQTVPGAAIEQVIQGTPAASAGLEAGDVITAVGNTQIGSSDELTTALDTHKPGDSVSITWTDTNGQSQTANITLTSGPAA